MARAVRFDGYGGSDVLYVAEVDEPSPQDGHLVVEVVATGINPGEIMIREGGLAEVFPADFPSGQGSDFSGRIHAVGGGVRGWTVGDEVVGWSDNRDAQADFVVVPHDQVTVRPPAASWDETACLHVAGITAYGVTRTLAVESGETVVVTAAAGGVGVAVTQMLLRAGCRVLAVAGADNDDYLRSLGAEPVNHGDGLGHRLNQAAPDGIDAVADLYGGGYVELAVGLGVSPERVVTIIDQDAADRFGAKIVWGYEYASAAVLAELVEDVADGDLVFPIAATFPLEDVGAAYDRLADRHTRGKIVLRVREPDQGE